MSRHSNASHAKNMLVWSLGLALAMVLLCVSEARADAVATATAAIDESMVQGVTYLDENGVCQTAPDCKDIVNGRYFVKDNSQATIYEGWNVMMTGRHFENRVSIQGDVKLIISSSADATFDKGIRVEEGSSLTMYVTDKGTGVWRSNEYGRDVYVHDDHPGRLVATGEDSCAAIGSDKGHNCGKITIAGCTLDVTGGKCGAGIGSGSNGNGGDITITGVADVTATGGFNGAGIGGGDNRAGGMITIANRARVTATGGERAAGIGGGDDGKSGTIRIDGCARVEATGSKTCAIGRGESAKDDGVILLADGYDVYGRVGRDGRIAKAEPTQRRPFLMCCQHVIVEPVEQPASEEGDGSKGEPEQPADKQGDEPNDEPERPTAGEGDDQNGEPEQPADGEGDDPNDKPDVYEEGGEESQTITMPSTYEGGDRNREQHPEITIGAQYCAERGDVRGVGAQVTRYVPEGWELVEQGALYARDFANPTEENFIIGGEGVGRRASTNVEATGNTRLVVIIADDAVRVTHRGYMIVRNVKTGREETLYTEIVTSSYDNAMVLAAG